MKKILLTIFGFILLLINTSHSTGTVYFLQDFENVAFPPTYWISNGVYPWVLTTYCSGYGVGARSMVADFYDVASGNLDLITPTFPVTTSGDSVVFDHAYATAVGGYNDRLDIYYSTNGGSTWTLLISLVGGNSGPLVTAPPTNNLFVPTPSQWATKRYALPVGTNRLKFEGVSAFGNNLYLDNIRVGVPYTNDVGANSLTVPKWAITPGSVSPVGSVRNYGTTTQSFSVTLTINPGSYTNTQNITNLAPGATQQVTFASFNFSTNGLYTMRAYTNLAPDQNHSNDTVTSTVTVTPAPRKVLLEFCTGTWCQWCPCGDSVAHHLAVTYPDNSVILAYHGGSDPYAGFNGNSILGLLGLNAYPSGYIDRRWGSAYQGGWGMFFTDAELRLSQYPSANVNIIVNSITYNPSTRALAVNFTATALQNLSGQYKVNYVITENNLVYPQVGNGYCPPSSVWIHNWVVRNMVNGATGDNVNTGGTWNQGQSYTMSFNTTINAAWQVQNCDLQMFIYKEIYPLNTGELQQSYRSMRGLVGINNQNSGVPAAFELSQNYPNPFNPVTNIHFSIPKDGNVSLKVYNSLGQLVATYLDGFVKAGYYNAEVDGTNFASGVYFYTLSGSGFIQTKKMILVK